MGLQQFERRLERMVESVFARAFRSGLQPVEVGRRLTREMDLRRTVAPRGTLAPNEFIVSLSSEDRERFLPIEDELINELISIAQEHGRADNYVFIGPVAVTIETDEDLGPGTMRVVGEMLQPPAPQAALVMPDGRRLILGSVPFTIGRLPECSLVLSDANVSRRHAEIRASGGDDYTVTDLGSTNGTRINGVPVTSPQILREGDALTVGNTTIQFERQ
jgi:hypothetical protein